MTRHWGPTPTAPAWRGTGCSSNAPRARAWTAFWREQGGDSRCLANVHPDLRRSLDGHWSALAAQLAPSARILDLGCGAGAIGGALLAARGDFRITGVDQASIPRPSDRRLALLPDTPMENLPFEDGSFDAAVSQFGLEYGHVRQAARELARVLVPGAPFSFLVHHAGSSIVRRSRTRNQALRRLLGEAVKRAFLSGNAAGLDRQIRAIRDDAPAEAIVGQIEQALQGRVGRSGPQRAAIWGAVAAALAPERDLLDALEACCVAPGDLGRWLASFVGRFEIRTAAAMRRPNGEVVAWKVEGVKSAPETVAGFIRPA